MFYPIPFPLAALRECFFSGESLWQHISYFIAQRGMSGMHT